MTLLKMFFSVMMSFILITSWGVAAYAIAPHEQLQDPVLEERARALEHELRCLVCQNQSISGSDAELAKDLRKLIREKIIAGKSDRQIKMFLVKRYGEFILMTPSLKKHNWLLWGTPFLVVFLLICYCSKRLFFMRNHQEKNTQKLSKQDEKRIEALFSKMK